MEKTVLLVDDEEDIRLVLGLALTDMGYRVLTAENGEEGWRIFQSETPPIIITDIKMPDIDGVELLRRIKGHDPDAEVIMITGHGDMDVAIESFQRQATDFITKPINVDALETALKRVSEKILARRKLREYTESLEGLVYEKALRLAEADRPAGAQRADDVLRAVQERFRSMFDDLPCYFTVHDPDLRLTAVNRRFKRDFEAEIGARCYEVVKRRSRACPDCPVLDTFGDGQSHQTETQLITRDGDEINAVIWTAPIRDSAGETALVAVMATDMSQILQVHHHLTSLGLMLGSMSHGIKGLLTGLDGGMYLLDSGVKKGNQEKVQEGLEMVKLMAGRIRNLVLDVLLFSKERELERKPFDLPTFAEETARVVESRMRQASIDLVREFADDLGTLEADQSFLRMALINILENAFDACLEPGGPEDRRVVFRVTRDREQVVFEVRDNGVGMDEQTRAAVFTMFFSTKGKQGTGLGLYVSRKIVQRHGGDIEAESELGRGTRFTVRLPLSRILQLGS
ncbi:MAG: response regulator [Proteobacteria bacterium]|nr:response regulator [Pseudomonadota bacterium]